MKMKIYAIYDSVSVAYMQPFFCINEQVAMRHFRNLANDSQSNIARNPQDFVLYQIGTFDDQSAEIIADTPAKHLGVATSYLETLK